MNLFFKLHHTCSQSTCEMMRRSCCSAHGYGYVWWTISLISWHDKFSYHVFLINRHAAVIIFLGEMRQRLELTSELLLLSGAVVRVMYTLLLIRFFLRHKASQLHLSKLYVRVVLNMMPSLSPREHETVLLFQALGHRQLWYNRDLNSQPLSDRTNVFLLHHSGAKYLISCKLLCCVQCWNESTSVRLRFMKWEHHSPWPMLIIPALQ